MKPQTILILSLVGNLALAATAFHFISPQTKIAKPDSIASVDSQQKTPQQSKPAEKLVVTNFTADDFSWHNIEAQDYKDYIANLRAVDCPEETIRDIIVADVNKLYVGKLKAIRGEDGEYKYWKSSRMNWNSKEGLERQKQMRSLEKEKSALLVELLGVDPIKERNKEMGYEDYRDRQVGFLPEEKRGPAREIQEKFQEQKQEIYREGNYEAEDWRKLRQIEKAEQAELATFLTPQELEQYQFRNAQTANQLRSDLDGFEPTEEEFKNIFRLREARADDLITSNDPDDKETQERRQKTTEEVDAQIKAQMGDARFEEYKRAQDWNYKELARLSERLELPKGSAAAVYDMKKAAEDEVKKVRSDQALTNDQRNQALQEIRDATEKAITETMGEAGLKKYRTRGGWWINNLSPSSPKTSGHLIQVPATTIKK